MSLIEFLLSVIVICLVVISIRLKKILKEIEFNSEASNGQGDIVKIKDYVPRFNEDLGKISRTSDEILEVLKKNNK